MIEELDTSKYEEDIQAIEKKVANLGHIPDLVAFYGSSSIRLWETLKSDMSPLEVINLGFGGSSYPYCHMYFYRIFKNLKPSKIVLYAGDNDLGTGHEPTRILRNFNLLLNDIVRKFRNANIYTISIKPSPRREGLMPKTVNQPPDETNSPTPGPARTPSTTPDSRPNAKPSSASSINSNNYSPKSSVKQKSDTLR